MQSKKNDLPSLFRKQEERNDAAITLRMVEANLLHSNQTPTIVAFTSIGEQFCRSSLCLSMEAFVLSSKSSTAAIFRGSTCAIVLRCLMASSVLLL